MSTGIITLAPHPSTTRYGKDFKPIGQIKPYLLSSGYKEGQEYQVSLGVLMKWGRLRLREDPVHLKLLKMCGLGTTSAT